MLPRTMFVSLIALAAAVAQGPGGPPPPGHGRFGPDAARFLGAEAGMPGHVVKNAPYAADIVTESTQTLADGSHIRQSSTAHVARDSEGRTRREQSLAGLRALGNGASLPQVVFINDPVAGVNYALNPGNKTANKSTSPAGRGRGNGPAPQQAMPHAGGRPGWGNHPNQNVKTESLGTQVIEGVTAQGTRTTLVVPAGQMGNEQPLTIVSERWYSPDLQTVVLSKRSDPRTGDTVMRMTNVSRAEPSPTQFQVPSDFQVTQGRGPRPGGGASPAQQ